MLPKVFRKLGIINELWNLVLITNAVILTSLKYIIPATNIQVSNAPVIGR